MSPRSLTYTGVGMIFFVILPFFLIASNHMQKNLPGHDCTVTDVSGQAFVQYQVTHLLVQQPQKSPSYTKTSQWIPLKKGADIGFGALIKTEKNAFVDIMMQNAAAFRIKEKSLVTLVQDPQKPKTIELALNEGKILSRVIGKKSSQSEKGEGIYRVKTPTATVRVHGTTFSVDYLPPKELTQVAVLDGAVYVKSNAKYAMDNRVYNGKKIQITPSARYPCLMSITSDIKKELEETQLLKYKPTGKDRWDEMMDLVVASPFFNKALTIITNYEMKTFKRTIVYYARLCWDNTVPATLKAVELEQGDYKDPWDTDYFYEKLDKKGAVLISAGPDKLLHTQDDLFLAIDL